MADRKEEKGAGLDNVKTFDNVTRLDLLHLPDGSPNIEVVSTAINYDLSSIESTDYKDRVAFPSTAFTEETKSLEEMATLLEKGREFISMLYCFRSVSKAIPMVQQDTPQEVRNEIYQKTFSILRPEVLKMKRLMEFHEEAVRVITKNVRSITQAEAKKQQHSEDVLDGIIRCIDMLVILDALKDIKACLLNDFSRYKRAFAPIKNDLQDSEAINEEITKLQMFLTNPEQPHYLIMHHLKTDIQQVQNYDLVIIALMEHCRESIEQKRYLLPSEEHSFLRVQPFLIYLLDSAKDVGKNTINVFKFKKIDLRNYQRILKHRPIIPLYADMTIDVLHVLRRCRSWDEQAYVEQWQSKKTDKTRAFYELKFHRARFRAEYTKLVMDVAHYLNVTKALQREKKQLPIDPLYELFDCILDAFRKLSSWAAQIKLQCAWKYARPIDAGEYKKRGGRGEAGAEFEKAVRYNYNEEELYALIDVIGMIKGLGGLLMKNELLLVPLIRRCIHDKCQVFLQKEVARPLRKAFKRSRKETMQVMLQMRDIGGDWHDYVTQKDDYKQKKKILVEVNRDFPRRSTAPTLTQITLIRRMMVSIFSSKSAGMQVGFFGGGADLKKEWIPIWEEFYRTAHFFKYLMDFTRNLRELTDMSDLWYREFYLEMTKQVQFPIDMSLPWILTDFIIKTPSMKENIFFPMDIYNDAAARALATLRQQFLYDEIEAELNLSFDQLVFHLSEEVFKYFKTSASAVLIDKAYEKSYLAAKKKASFDVINSRYIALMKQRHIQLLGRSVDLNLLISQHVNGTLRQNLEYIIRRFEASDLTFVVGLKLLLDNFKLTHELLSEYLTVDPIDKMMKEINEDVTIGQFRGRILWHTFSEIVSDLFPNFVFNSSTQRYVRGPSTFSDPPQREKPPAGVQPWFWFGRHYRESFERVAEVTRGYFGVEHMEALLSVLSYTDIPLIIHEAVTDISNKTVMEFSPYAKALSAVLPPMKLPSLFYGVVGGYGYFDIKLAQNIGRYKQLRSGVFQLLREIGNTILFVRLLEATLKKLGDFEFQSQAFFQGVVPLPPPKPVQKGQQPPPPKDSPFLMPTGPSPVGAIIKQTASLLTSMGDKEQGLLQHLSTMAEEAPRLYEFNPKHTSMLTAALERLTRELQAARVKEEWKGNPPEASEILNVEKPNDIIRLWSCLLFIFCQPPPEAVGGVVVDDLTLFGEGFLWAGCLLIHLMGYRDRFEFMDFSYHILKLAALKPLPPEEDKKVKKSKKKEKAQPGDEIVPKARIFLKNIAHIKSLNESIFASLETYLVPPKPVPFQLHPPDKDVNEFVPVRRLSLNPLAAGGRGPAATVADGKSATLSPGRPAGSAMVATGSPGPSSVSLAGAGAEGDDDDDDDDDKEEKKIEPSPTPKEEDDDDSLLEGKAGQQSTSRLEGPGGLGAPPLPPGSSSSVLIPRTPSGMDGDAGMVGMGGEVDFDAPPPVPGFSIGDDDGEAPQLPDSFEGGF